MNWFNRTDIADLSIENCCEISAIETKVLNCIIVTIYRPPSGDFKIFLEIIEQLLIKIAKTKSVSIINGDFNVHFNLNDSRKKDLLNIMNSFGFYHQIFEKTTILNTLDNIFVNFEDQLNFTTQTLNPCISDHYAVTVSVNLGRATPKPRLVMFRPITQRGKCLMFQQLQVYDWSFVCSDWPIDQKFDMFMKSLIDSMKSAFPIRTYINKNESKEIKWFNQHIRKMRESLRLLTELYEIRPSPALGNHIKSFRNKYRNEINQTKQKAYSSYIINSGNIARASWQIIKSQNKSNTKTNESALTADDFNDFFVNVADDLIKEMPDLNEPDINSEKYMQDFQREKLDCLEGFSFKEVSCVKVREALDLLKNKSSKDIFDMNIGLIKYMKNVIISPLTRLINEAIREGIYPTCFKISKVIPIYKKGDLNIPGNFRPVTLTPVVSKVFEFILRDQLYNYLEKNNLFMSNQFGFRSGKSTTLAILNLMEHISEAFEEGHYMETMFCDLSKAFDCVSHDILLRKLKHYKLSNISLKLIKSYLTDRYQQTCKNRETSGSRKSKHGVPQGSLLAPLLFLIYVNDISRAVPNAGLILYADDTTIWHKDSDYLRLQVLMDENIRGLQDWFTVNKLSLNNDKSLKTTFTLRKLNQNNRDRIKFLGVCLDPGLTFETHLDYVTNRLAKSIFLLRNLKSLVPMEALMQAFHGVFQSVLCYAILAWGHSCHSERVFRLQRRAVRVIGGIGYREDVRHKFIELKIMTVPSRYVYECLIYAYKNYDSFDKTKNYNCSVRTQNNFRMQFLRLSRSRIATNYYCLKFFNKVPDTIKLKPFPNFKNEIKQILTSNAFYSINEFLSFNFNNVR